MKHFLSTFALGALCALAAVASLPNSTAAPPDGIVADIDSNYSANANTTTLDQIDKLDKHQLDATADTDTLTAYNAPINGLGAPATTNARRAFARRLDVRSHDHMVVVRGLRTTSLS